MNKWELVEGELYRMWVPGGWIVKDKCVIVGSVMGHIQSTFYVPDKKHEWENN